MDLISLIIYKRVENNNIDTKDKQRQLNSKLTKKITVI